MRTTKTTPTAPIFTERVSLKQLLPSLFRYVKLEKRLFIETILLTLLLTGFGLLIPKGISAAIDLIPQIGVDKTLQELLVLLAVLLGLYLVQCLLAYLEERKSAKLFLNVAHRMRGDYFRKITAVTLGYVDATRHGDLISRGSNDIETVVTLLSEVVLKLVSSVTLFVGCLVIMFTISWQLTAICLGSALVTVLATKILAHFIRKHAAAQQSLLGGLTGFLEDSLLILKSIKLYNRQTYLSKKFVNQSESLKKESVSTLTWMSLVGPVNNLIGNLNFILVAVVGGALSLSDTSGITVSTIVLFILYIREYTETLNDLSEISSEVQPAMAAADRYFEVLNAPEEVSVTGDTALEDGSVELTDLHFSYVQDREVLSGINLHIESGQHVAIVGASGCGKTTLVQVLLRLYQPDSGTVRIGGRNAEEIPLPVLRKNVIAIMQDDIVFDETMAYNLAYGTAETPGEVATCWGVDAREVPSAEQLSRGQIQKICVLRAFSSEAKVIILDESLSLVDPITYDRLFSELRQKFPSATFITITHQLSCLKQCDNIFFLADGTIVEQGTFTELVNRGGEFYRMLKNEN